MTTTAPVPATRTHTASAFDGPLPDAPAPDAPALDVPALDVGAPDVGAPEVGASAGLAGSASSSPTTGNAQARAWERDWQLQCREHDHRVPGWAERHPVLAGCTELSDVLAAVRDDPDAVLGALLAEDRSGCPAAARVVLESMRPKMLLMAATHRSLQAGDCLAQLWIVIRRYPLQRRPERIAANLVMDTWKGLLAERDDHLLPVEEDRLDQLRSRSDRRWAEDPLGAGEVLCAAENLGLITPETSRVLFSVYAEGLPGRRAAARHRLGASALRERCSRAVRRLADHADELAEAA